jgi:hypothetical protein
MKTEVLRAFKYELMPNGKKYSAFAIHNADGSWVARIVRRKTSKGSVVERERVGFDSQETAQAWATEQLALYLAQRKEQIAKRNAKRSAHRIRQAERAALVSKYSYRELAERSEHELDCRAEFKARVELLWQEIAFRMLKEDASDYEAFAEADTRVGRRYQERLDKAKSGLLDTVEFGTRQMAVANAQFLRQWAVENLAK